MLELASRIALGLNISGFLQLQRAFASNRVMDGPAKIQHRARALHRLRKFPRTLFPAGSAARMSRDNVHDLVTKSGNGMARHPAPQPGQVERSQVKHDQLRGETLRRWNRLFVPA